MGGWLSRRQQSSSERLEQLERKICKLESYRRTTQMKQRRCVGYLILIAIFVYIITAILGFTIWWPHSLEEIILRRLLPMTLFPCMAFGLKLAMCWCFARQLAFNDEDLELLREQRRELLDEVKSKETYKVAKEILEKYDPATKLANSRKELAEMSLRRRAPADPSPSSSMTNTKPPHTTPQIDRTPRLAGPAPNSFVSVSPGAFASTPGTFAGPTARQPSMGPNAQRFIPTPLVDQTPRFARPILPKDRGPLDKLLDYVLADGPNNRYALICAQCHAHNGMALKEDFEFLAFRCCYCFAFNPAKRQKFQPPKLESLALMKPGVRQFQGPALELLEPGADLDRVPPQDRDRADSTTGDADLETQHNRVEADSLEGEQCVTSSTNVDPTPDAALNQPPDIT